MALGEDRQGNMRQEGFELLVERGSGIIYLGGKAFQIEHICQKRSQSKGGEDWEDLEVFTLS